MFPKKNPLLLLVLVLVASAFSAQAQDKRKVSLLVAYCDKGEGICDEQHLEKFDFRNGVLVSRKIVVSLNSDAHGYANRVIDNRYMLTSNNKIFDLQAGKFIDEFPGLFKGRGKAELPGPISPDGRKSVYAGGHFGSTDKLEIHFVGKPTVVVKDSFQVFAPANACYMPSLPLVWIDNERILTQRSNGNLVIVSLDGKISPFLQLPCTNKDGVGLERNKSHKIVYECNGDEYFIDVENKRFEKIKRDLGNGFSLDFVRSKDVYYYNDKEIGRDGLDAVSIRGYLAMLYGESKNGAIDSATIKTIKVWNVIKKDWIKLTVDGWGAEIIGWIER